MFSKTKIFVENFFLIGLLAVCAGAQSPAQEYVRERDLRRIERAENNLLGTGNGIISLTGTESSQFKQYLSKKLSVADEVVKQHQSFLAQPNTGIFKLIPILDCSRNKSNRKKCLIDNQFAEMFGNAFSFQERTHRSRLRADIALRADRISAEESEFQTIIVSLGDIALESVTLESKGVSYLNKIEPKSQIKDVREQFKTHLDGVTNENYRYSKAADLKLNNTYVIRSVAYEGNKFVTAKFASDIVIALRLIGRDEHGGALFLCKELSVKSAPRLVYDQPSGDPFSP